MEGIIIVFVCWYCEIVNIEKKKKRRGNSDVIATAYNKFFGKIV